jgi:hypothetical protein
VEEPGNPGQSDIDGQVVGGSTVALGTDAPAWARPYKSARTRAVMATIALSLLLASVVAFLWIVQNYETVVSLFGDETTFAFWWTLLYILLLFAAAVTFLFWFARAYRNLPSLGAHELKYSPRSAVGWWFVPLASMVLPLLVTIELSKASDPSTRPNSRSERGRAPFSKLLLTWWVAFMAATILAGLPISSQEAVWFAVLAALEILAVGLAIAVIWRIQLRQDAGQQPREDAAQSLPPQGRASRFKLILGLTGGGGCLGVIALAVVLLVLFFQDAAKKCPPKDLPVYPGAQQTDFNYQTSGATSQCSVGWASDATSNEVSTFYEASLSTGAWQLVSKDAQSGAWYFQRRGDESTIGRMGFSGNGTQTRIEVQILTGQSPTASASP